MDASPGGYSTRESQTLPCQQPSALSSSTHRRQVEFSFLGLCSTQGHSSLLGKAVLTVRTMRTWQHGRSARGGPSHTCCPLLASVLTSVLLLSVRSPGMCLPAEDLGSAPKSDRQATRGQNNTSVKRLQVTWTVDQGA